MGEHHRNPNVLMRASTPTGGPTLRVELHLANRLKTNVHVVPADHIREVNGKTEVLTVSADGDKWAPVPEGDEVLAEGTKVGLAYMDAVVALVAVASAGVTGPRGELVGRGKVLRELFRQDAAEFMVGLVATGEAS